MTREILASISKCSVTVVMCVLIFLFFYEMYKPKYRIKIPYAIVFMLWSVIMLIVNDLDYPPINLLYVVLTSNIICVKMFNTTFKKSLLYNFLLLLIMFFSDSATVFIWTVAEGRNLYEIISNSELMIASNLMNMIVMFLGYKLYTAVIDSNRIKAIKVNEAVFLLLMTLFESYVIYNYMWKADSSRDGIIIITMLLGFLFFDIYITYIIQQISESYKYKYELSMANRQNEIQLAYYRDMEVKYQKSRIVIHDIKKHLSILGELKNTDNTKAVKYGNFIEEEINSLFFGFHCSNQILSIVTSQKIASAEKEKIEVITKIQDLNLDFINDFDITAIFANLWDNAIEACVKLSEERRFIKLYMKKINGFIIINMENSFDNDIIKSKDKILSTKDNHIGVGLSIIDDTVKKYDGLFITEPKDGVFNAEITIPIPIN